MSYGLAYHLFLHPTVILFGRHPRDSFFRFPETYLSNSNSKSNLLSIHYRPGPEGRVPRLKSPIPWGEGKI